MALVLADRVQDTTISTGVGSVTLSGTPPAGFQGFSAIGDGNTTYYTISGGTQWEVGIGTYSAAGPSLSRDTVLASSSGGALVNFSAGVKAVFVTYPAEKSVNYDAAGNVNISITGNAATVTDGVYTSNSYANPSWITSLAVSKLSGTVAISQGGTGATTASDARTNLGLGTAATLDAGTALGVATLDSGGTVPLSQLPSSIKGGVSYQGTWNASTNTPTLTSSVGTKGYYYVVSVAGSTNLNGVTSWNVGDWAIFNGTAWEKVDNTDAVTSVNGYTGTVNLVASDISGFATVATTGAISDTTGTLATSRGGTGITSFTSGGAVYATSTSALTTGTLPATAGGTGSDAVPTAGGVAYGTGTAFALTAAGTTGQVLLSNGSSAPTWGSAPFSARTILEFTQTITTNYTITGGQNGLSVGPVSISSGVSVTVPSGQRWVVL